MNTGAKITFVLAAGLLSSLATAVYLNWEALRGSSNAPSPLAVIVAEEGLVPKAEPADLLATFIVPARDRIRQLSKQESTENSEEVAQQTVTVVQATEQLLKIPTATPEEREQANAAEMESLYLATRFNAAKFAGALVEACDRVIHDAPGTEAAAHADTYKILYRYFGEWSDEADARTALHEFAEKYPNNKLGADLFIAYAQRQDRAGAKATLTEARAMYADGAAAQKIDEKLAAIGIYEAADAQTKKTDPAKRSRPQKPTTTTKPETKPRKPLYSSGGRRITFSAPTLEGKTVTTGQFQGKVVLIDFWATWCGPCVREIPNVKAVYDKYHRHGLEVIGVSLDNDPEKLRAFLDQNRLSWPQVFFQGTKERGWNNPIAKKYGIQSIPTMFLLDRSGHLVTTDLRGHGALERAVEEQLFGATTASR